MLLHTKDFTKTASTLHANAKDFNKNCFYSTCKKTLPVKCISMQKNFNKKTEKPLKKFTIRISTTKTL